MRVLEVSQNYPSRFYYMGTPAKQAIDAIALDKKIDVDVISPKAFVIPIKGFPYHNFSKIPLTEKQKNYTIHYPRYLYLIPKSIFYSLMGKSYAFFVNKFIRKKFERNKPDLIHAHIVYPDGYAMMKLAKEWKIPLVVHIRGTLIRKVAREDKKIREQIVETLNYASKIISVSRELTTNCAELGIDKNKIEVIPNGIDMKIFKTEKKIYARKKLGLPLWRKTVLYVGNIREIKGPEYLIRAIPHIAKKEKDVLFVIVGEGELTITLKNLAEELKISDNVLFVGPKNHSDIVDWINSADVVCIPSLSEGRPNIALESMACEKPIVATNVGGIPELVHSGYNGFLCNPKNSKQLADKLSLLLRNSELAKKMGRNGLKKIHKDGLTWENHARKTIALYENVVREFKGK